MSSETIYEPIGYVGSVLVTRKGKLAGIITTVDICRAFADLIRTQPPPDVVA